MAQYDPDSDLKLLEMSYDSLKDDVMAVQKNWEEQGVEVPEDMQNACKFLTGPSPFAGQNLRLGAQDSEADDSGEKCSKEDDSEEDKSEEDKSEEDDGDETSEGGLGDETIKGGFGDETSEGGLSDDTSQGDFGDVYSGRSSMSPTVVESFANSAIESSIAAPAAQTHGSGVAPSGIHFASCTAKAASADKDAGATHLPATAITHTPRRGPTLPRLITAPVYNDGAVSIWNSLPFE